MIAAYIDHTLLSPTATREDIARICEEARIYGFATVCVQPVRVAQAAKLLAGTAVGVCTVVGFPHGANGGAAKAAEAARALKDGATEIDMVMNLGAAKDGDWATVAEEIAAVKKAVGAHVLKVIIETSQLTDDEIVAACRAAVQAGADFVKTSTGFTGGGATVEAVALMRRTVGAAARVKASGGVRDYACAQAMIAAGADRIGASAGVAICREEATAGKDHV